MKIIHTSDWHLGQVLYDYDRSEEHLDMLHQITDIVREQQPDAMVVSGDIFHTGTPSTTAVEMYNQAILDMHEACPTMPIIVTAGNHDSAARLVVNNVLWEHFQVHVIGHIAKHNGETRTPDYAPHVIPVLAKDQQPIGYIAAIPHCYDSNYPSVDPDLQRGERARAYYAGLADYIHTLNTSHLPVVLMAHMAITGCDLAGHDTIGGMESRDADIFGSEYDYIALGHIHTPQNINAHMRYSGTPIPVNFGEKFEHSVSIVTVEHGQTPRIETRTIHNLIPLQDFPTHPLPFNQVLEQLREFDPSRRCYLRLMVKVDDTLSPLANTLVADALRGKQCRFCLIKPFMDQLDNDNQHTSAHTTLNVEALKEKTPLQIAQMFFALKGLELSDTKKQMIHLATQRAEQNKKENIHDEA